MPREIMSYQCTVCKEVYPTVLVAQRCEDLHRELHELISTLPKGTLLMKSSNDDEEEDDGMCVFTVEHVTTLLVKQRPSIRLMVSSVDLKGLANIGNQADSLSVLPPMLFVFKDEDMLKRLFADFSMTGVLVACNFRLLTRKEQQALLKFTAKQAALLVKFSGELERTKLKPLSTIDTSMLRDKKQAPC